MRIIKVLLYCDLPSLWNSFAALYISLLQDSRFDVTVLAMPELYNGKFKNYDIIDFFDQNGIAYIKGYDVLKKNYIKLSFKEYDYIFPNRPYDNLRPRQYINKIMSKYCALCHITYGTCIFDGKVLEIVCGFGHLHYYKFVFSETPIHTEIYLKKRQEYGNCPTQIITVGSPKFDTIRNLVLYTNKQYKQTVLYTPRWNLEEGTSSFLDIYPYFFDLVKNNPCIKYIFRPHPLMESTFCNSIWSQKEWTDFIDCFHHYPNAEIDLSSNYLEAFAQADVLVSDVSSLMAEFLLTEKPIIYMHKKKVFNVFGNQIAEGFYWCTNEKELEQTLKTLRSGVDSKKSLRRCIIKKNYYFKETNSVKSIKQLLIKEENFHVPSSVFKRFINRTRAFFRRSFRNGARGA